MKNRTQPWTELSESLFAGTGSDELRKVREHIAERDRQWCMIVDIARQKGRIDVSASVAVVVGILYLIVWLAS